MKIEDITRAIEKIVPLNLAQDWDNVGLLLGDLQSDVKNILLTIDVTRDVLSEAKKLKTDMIISYHPVIWDGLKKITVEPVAKPRLASAPVAEAAPATGAGAKESRSGPRDATTTTQGLVYDLIRCGIAVYSIHTALDSAIGGVNDGLAEIVGIKDAKPIGDYVFDPAGDIYKLVVFVPLDSAAKVSEAIFAAGAGWIGNYSKCGFHAQGTGTFLPLEGARPAVGRKGRLEKVPEIRFETIVPAEKLQTVVAAMKQAHPYEVPAFDIFKLYNNQNMYGLGRIGTLAKPLRIAQIIERIKKRTGATAFGIVGDSRRLVRTAAVCAGSCGKIINLVIAAKADLYLTGELKHHQALAAQEAGLTCICLSHTVSERFILKKFAGQLQKQIRPVKIRISRKDADPFTWKNI